MMKLIYTNYLLAILLTTFIMSCSSGNESEGYFEEPEIYGENVPEGILSEEELAAIADANNAMEEAAPINEEAAPINEEVVSLVTPKQISPEEGLAGTYTNGNGGTLIISNYHQNDGLEYVFEFQLIYSGTNENCQGIDFKGRAAYFNFTAVDFSSESNEDNFKFGSDFRSVVFEPVIDQIGMDCARALSINFKK